MQEILYLRKGEVLFRIIIFFRFVTFYSLEINFPLQEEIFLYLLNYLLKHPYTSSDQQIKTFVAQLVAKVDLKSIICMFFFFSLNIGCKVNIYIPVIFFFVEGCKVLLFHTWFETKQYFIPFFLLLSSYSVKNRVYHALTYMYSNMYVLHNWLNCVRCSQI